MRTRYNRFAALGFIICLCVASLTCATFAWGDTYDGRSNLPQKSMQTSSTSKNTLSETTVGTTAAGNPDATPNAIGFDSKAQADGAAGTNATTASGLAAPESQAGEMPKPQSGFDTPIVDGSYVIKSALADRAVVDVEAGSTADQSNVQVFESNMTGAQIWSLTHDSDGYYTIKNSSSGKVFDVACGIAKEGTNVWIYSPNSTAAQKWVIAATPNGFKIVSALSSNLVLDVACANSSNGSNIQIFNSNDTLAQRFAFLAASPSVPVGDASIPDGAYNVGLSYANGKVFDIPAASFDIGANVQSWSSNGSYAQTFYIAKDSEGYYSFINVGSGLAVDVVGANVVPGTNVWQQAFNGAASQKWAAYLNKDKTYTFINKATNLALDVLARGVGDGANIQTYSSNGTEAQKFLLTSVQLLSDGIASLYADVADGKSIDIPAASAAENAQVQIWGSNGTPSQKFLIAKLNTGGYTIKALCSGLYIGIDGSKIVQQSTAKAWTARFIQGAKGWGISFVDDSTQLVMDIVGASTNDGTKLQLFDSNGTVAQIFKIRRVAPIDNGYYTIASAIESKVIDVAGGNWQNHANIQIWSPNGTGAQVFNIVQVGEYYRFVNAMTGKAVDLTDCSAQDGANIQQFDINSSDAQLWSVQLTEDGWFTFVNKGTGKAIDVAGAGNYDGCNVDCFTQNGTNAQKWRIYQSSYNPDAAIQRALSWANARSSDTGYLICVDLSAHRVIVFEGQQGSWNPTQCWECSNGALNSPTVEGDFSIGIKGYSFGSGYTCYYYSQFCGNYLFHSIKYNQGTFDVQDGRLGMYISHGCVRLPIDAAYWIYSTVPSGSHVVVYS